MKMKQPFEQAVTAHRTTVDRQRLALAYHYLGGLRHTETAELIGGSPDAVRRAAADGIRTVRQIYRDEIAEGDLR